MGEAPPSAHGSSPLFLVAVLIGLAALGGAFYLGVYPGLTRRGGGNESAAIGALKTIANAQTLYREGDMDGNGTLEYAPALSCLINTGKRRDEDLIDEVLAAGAKSGYLFRIEFSADTRFIWAATAEPIKPGVTGGRYFGANMAGLIFFSSTGPVRFNADGSSTNSVLGQ